MVRMTRLPPAFDLLAACTSDHPAATTFLFERDGLGVAAASMDGITGMGAEPITEATVAALGVDMVARLQDAGDRSGAIPLTALGQIAFGPVGAATLQVPRRLVRRTDPGATWLQDVFPVSEDDEDLPPPFEPARPAIGAPSAPFATTQVSLAPSPQTYAGSVATAVERIRAGVMEKVVLARTMQVTAHRALDPVRLAQRLRAVDPHAYTFIAPLDQGVSTGRSGRSLLVGASPELLVSRRGQSGAFDTAGGLGAAVG